MKPQHVGSFRVKFNDKVVLKCEDLRPKSRKLEVGVENQLQRIEKPEAQE